MIADGFHSVPDDRLATVVTHLEARGPAKLGPPVFPEGVTPVRVAAPATDWYRALFRRVGEDWLWASRLAIAEADLAAVLATPEVEIWTLRGSGVDLALLELDFRTSGIGEIAFFGLAAELMGRGIGRPLMALAQGRAWSRQIEVLRLHTCTHDHPGALRFYGACGFVPVRREVEVMEDPRLTGLLRADAAPHVPMIPAR